MLHALTRLALLCVTAATFGCAPVASSAPRLSLRVLSSEPASIRQEPDAAEDAPRRIGAPGGSGSGTRRVQPLQSGKDAVGGLPAGMGSTGRRG